MGRRAMNQRLNIWMNGIPVGYWETTRQVGLGADAAERLIQAVTEATEGVIGAVGALLPDGFPMDVAEAIFNGMRRQSARLSADH